MNLYGFTIANALVELFVTGRGCSVIGKMSPTVCMESLHGASGERQFWLPASISCQLDGYFRRVAQAVYVNLHCVP